MGKYYRFFNGLRKFNQGRMQPEEAVATARTLIQKRVASREENFLKLIEKGVFGYRRSPYLQLLEPRKIKFSDLESWVSKSGIEGSLERLQSEGVYFTVDEFKGKVPVQRNGVEFRCDARRFDNPFLSCVYEVRSGATQSAGTRVPIDFEYLHQRSLYDALLLNVHGCLTSPIANWFPVFPGAPGINSSLRFAHIGNPVRRWFSQVAEDDLKMTWERKWGTKLMFGISRLCGNPLAKPEFVGLNDARQVAEWASRILETHANCVIYTFAASAVRVCIAATEANRRIRGAKFLVTGEPLTPQKRKEIESTGAKAVPVYGISEAGVIAAGCNQPHVPSDHCHLYNDTIAVIAHRCSVPHSGRTVDSFLFSSILYESPKLLLNVGMGDYGRIDAGECDCEFGRMGFNTHLSDIRSYEKLTGEGVTFVDTDFVRILESLLPANFGGRSTDYQLIEEEDSRGLTHLFLMVSPRVGEVDEREVLHKFFDFLQRGEASPESWSRSGTAMWMQSGTVRVKRGFPIPTRSGKILPFHFFGAAKPKTQSASAV
jgi:hypothetical protein